MFQLISNQISDKNIIFTGNNQINQKLIYDFFILLSLNCVDLNSEFDFH